MAGRQLLRCAQSTGLGKHTPVHAVGDGVPWIADQVKNQLGTQGSYLLDFYYVCHYLSTAAKAIVADEQKRSAWLDDRKA